jgi:uncharacterized membrane protein
MKVAPNRSAAGPAVPLWAVLLTLVILAASLARLMDPERMLVWHDEVYTALRVFGFAQGDLAQALFSGRLLTPGDLLRLQTPAAEYTWLDTLQALARHPEHSPLYYLSARLASQWVGSPLLALRGTAVVYSLLLLPSVFWMMRELFGPGRAPWVAAALVAVSPLHLLYGQEARQYELWAVLMVASSAALLRALRRGRGSDWRCYGATVALGLYSHLLFLSMLAVHGTYLALARPRGLEAAPPVGRRWLMAVGIALVLFSPWLALLLLRVAEVQQYVAWMERPMGSLDALTAWGRHLVRLFVDPAPVLPRWLLLLLLPLAWALGRFCAFAPAPARWLPCLMVAVSLLVVLAPDLFLGGSRSQHARYVLPALLAVQLAVAWVVAAEWQAPTHGRRVAALLVLSLLLGMGAWSDARILRADTWWSKNFSAQNAAIARRVNAAQRPVVLASNEGVSAGELISLAYHLRPGVALWGEPAAQASEPPQGFGDIFVLTPSPLLRQRLERTHRLVPLRGTWQWFHAQPLGAPGGQEEGIAGDARPLSSLPPGNRP